MLSDVIAALATPPGRAALALVRRVLPLLGTTLDLSDLEDAVKQFDTNLAEVVNQNAKIKGYVAKLEASAAEEEPHPSASDSELPPASELLGEIEQFLRQQRPKPED